jgi:acetyltransferase-like isoleucine patch superfamily enzyme
VIKNVLRKLLRHIAFKYGRGVSRWQAACHPPGEEWAAWLKLHGGFQAMGEHCSIQRNVVISDPAYVRMGSNVRLSGCTLFGHDGSVNMLNRAYGLKLDSVGKIDIQDNVYVGHGAIVLPGVTIGMNSIVAAGAVVNRDVEAFSVYGGVPARRLCGIGEMLDRIADKNVDYPWAPLIEQRDSAFDPAIEPELVRRRVEHFYGGARQLT